MLALCRRIVPKTAVTCATHSPSLSMESSESDYFAGIEDQENQVRTVFVPNACNVCKVLRNPRAADDATASRLSSCSGCRLIAYCNVQHQKDHWPKHKSFCKAVQQILRKEGKTSLFAGVDSLRVDVGRWKMIRYNYMVNIEAALKRPMEAYEREMLLYPRVCATCYLDDGAKLIECPKCRSSFWCCDDHKPKGHELWCNDLRVLLDLNLEQSRRGHISCPLPRRQLTDCQELSDSIKEFLVTRMLGPMGAMALTKQQMTLLTEMASYPLTVLWALQEAARETPDIPDIHQRQSLVIHVVGAEVAFECNNLYKWDVFNLNVLPNLRQLLVTFIGPELTNVPPGMWDEDLRCPHCVRLDKQFVCDFQPNTFYHDYVQGPSYIRPDVIVAFNCGLYRQTGFAGSDSWGKTVPYLLKEGVPLIMTAYTAAEAPLDLQRLEQVWGRPTQVLVAPRRNPYRSGRPCRNFVSEEESPLIFKNQFITCVRNAEAASQ